MRALLLLLLPLTTLAQPALEVPRTPIPANWTQELIAAAIAVLVPVAWKFYQKLSGENAARRREQILAVGRTVFWMTEEAKRLVPGQFKNAADTISFAEIKLLAVLEAQGITPTNEEMVLAKAQWGAIHGVEKVRAEIAEASGLAAAVPR